MKFIFMFMFYVGVYIRSHMYDSQVEILLLNIHLS